MVNGISGNLFHTNPYLPIYGMQGVGGVVRARTAAAAQPELPVQPVEPVDAAPGISAPAAQAESARRWDSGLTAMAARGRMQRLSDEELAFLRGAAAGEGDAPAKPDGAAQAALPLPGSGQETGEDSLELPGAGAGNDAKSAREVMEESECQTCKERKYQDGSDDPGVSFKTAAHIDPELAAAKVRGHEMEHVAREQTSAAREDRKIVCQTVSYQTAICPECGRAYVSGGTTRTATAANREPPAERAENGGQSAGGFSALV